MRRVLVTGSRGLVGGYLLALLARNHEVFAIQHRGAEPASVEPNVNVISADLSHPLDRSALPERIDAVVHLAQSNRYRDFPEGAADMFQVNVAAVAALLEYARDAGARNFVYASTGSVYAPSAEPIREESALGSPGTLGYYPATRLAAELLVGGYQGVLNTVSLRFFFVYGRGGKEDMLIPRLVGNIRAGRKITLAQGKGMRFNPVHATDAAEAVIAAMGASGNHRVNVAGPEALSIRDLCDTAAASLGVEPNYETDEASTIQDMVADIERMKSLLRAPAIRFEEGVRDLL
jgi:UDP-glucose 4-epimerase